MCPNMRMTTYEYINQEELTKKQSKDQEKAAPVNNTETNIVNCLTQHVLDFCNRRASIL
jgi:hypothetical protein